MGFDLRFSALKPLAVSINPLTQCLEINVLNFLINISFLSYFDINIVGLKLLNESIYTSILQIYIFLT